MFRLFRIRTCSWSYAGANIFALEGSCTYRSVMRKPKIPSRYFGSSFSIIIALMVPAGTEKEVSDLWKPPGMLKMTEFWPNLTRMEAGVTSVSLRTTVA